MIDKKFCILIPPFITFGLFSPGIFIPVMTKQQQETAKQSAGEAAARLVESGMRVGIGTGSTTAYAIAALGRRIREEDLHISGVPTSFFAERLARKHGIPLTSLDEIERFDIAIDGADEVDTRLNLIKGRGAAMAREKVIASLSDRFVILVDPSKLVDRLGSKMPVPVEFLPMAAAPVRRAIERFGGRPELRMGLRKDGPVVTDQGFWVYDAYFESIDDPAQLDREIRLLPGVLEHGLFLNMATDVLVGRDDGTVKTIQLPGRTG